MLPSRNRANPSFLKEILLPSFVILSVITAGAFTGWRLSGKKLPEKSEKGSRQVQVGKEVGSKDEKTFRDKAEGILEEGGIEGEGTHHLVRDGGPSKYVYLTSSVVDLGEFSGRKVEVWGETFKGEKAGWLMDVGRIKVLD